MYRVSEASLVLSKWRRRSPVSRKFTPTCTSVLTIVTMLLLVAGTALAAPPSQWSTRGVGGGGALFAPSISPFNPSHIYMACDMSEQYHSTDQGLTWNTISFLELQANRNSQVQFTNNPQILYSIDWSNVGLDNAQRPTKSTDGGSTWTALAGDPTGGECWTMFADNKDANKVIVTSYNQIFFSSNGGQSFGPAIYTDNTGNGAHIAGVFWDDPNIYIATFSGMLVSTNNGASFAPVAIGGIPAGNYLVSVAGAKQNGVTHFVGITTTSIYQGITGADHYDYSGVYRLDYGQPNWTASTTGITAGDHPFYAAMSPTNTGTAYLGGGNENGVPIIYKTTNGGQSWTQVFLSTNNQNVATGWAGAGGDRGWGYPEYVLGLAVAPSDPNQVIFTDLGDAHLTTNGGTSWRQAYVSAADQNPAGASTPKKKSYHSIGLENTTNWTVCWSDANNVMAGFSDITAMRSTDGGVAWSFDFSGPTQNSMYSIVKNPTGVLYAASATVHDMYQSTRLADSIIDAGGGRVLFSTDMGKTWQTMHEFGKVVVWVELDPNNPNRLFASVAHSTQGGIYVTNNASAGAGSTWTKLANPPRTEGHPFNIRVLNDGTLVCSYSGRRTGSGFTASSGVFVSTDNGQSWIDRSHPGMLYWTKDVVIAPGDATQSTWYAGVFSGWGGAPNGLGGLYKTINRGVSWTRVNNNDRVTSCTINPANPDELYFTTEVDGLWYSSNATSGNPSFTRVASYPFRQPERVFFNPYANELWVTSFGSGLRVGSTAGGGTPGALQFSSATYNVNESGPTATITVTRTGGSSGMVGVTYATVAGGNATNGADYTSVTNTLSWASGDAVAKTFTIAIANNATPKSTETVNLALSAPSGGATLGTPATSILSITDDDPGVTYTLGGRITTAANVAIPNISVTRTGSATTVLTNATGYFTFANVPAGTYTITPTSNTFGFAPATRSITISNANISNANFTGYNAALTGRVAFNNGTGIGNAQVKLNSGRNVLTNGAGYYTFAGVVPGAYTVTPVLAGYNFEPAYRSVVIASTNVANINFIGGYSITGRLAGTNGVGLANLRVYRTGSSVAAISNGAGYYAFNGVTNGAYTITPDATQGYGYTPQTRSFTVSGASVANQNFTGATGYAIVGRVMTSNGAAIPNVSVKRTGQTAGVLTNSSGYYTFNGVPNGTYTITPTLSGRTFTPATKSVTVNGGNPAAQNFVGSG